MTIDAIPWHTRNSAAAALLWQETAVFTQCGVVQMETGVVTLTSFISPYARDRQMVRSRLPEGDFIEVYMNVTPHISAL